MAGREFPAIEQHQAGSRDTRRPESRANPAAPHDNQRIDVVVRVARRVVASRLPEVRQKVAERVVDREHPDMRIGIRVPQYGSSWPDVRDAALHVERLGFDGVWVNDHLQSPGRLTTEPTFDALTTLAALATVTTRTRLGIAVLSASYRPAPLATKMTTVLDVISGGRLIVGLGTGSDRAEHAAYGYPFGSPRERTAGLVEVLDVMQNMRDAPDGPRPNQPVARPPIWLAAHKPGLLRLAGQRADGVIVAWVPPGEFAHRCAIAEASRIGTDRGPLARCLYTFALAYPSERTARAWLKDEAAALGTTPASLLRWLRTTGIVGTPDEVRAQLAAYAEAKATDVVLALPSRTPLETLDALADSASAMTTEPLAG